MKNLKANDDIQGLHITRSAEETYLIGVEIGKKVPTNSVLCLFGDLAAGKTTLIKGIANGAAGIASDCVNSPTFTYLNIYEGSPSIFHFDLYRLHNTDEFLSMGFDEFFYAGGICCIEWAERIQGLLPSDYIKIQMEHLGEGVRRIELV